MAEALAFEKAGEPVVVFNHQSNRSKLVIAPVLTAIEIVFWKALECFW